MWFTETPWPPIAILGLLGGVCLLTALQNQRSKWLVASCVCVVLGFAVWFIERVIVTPGERVEGSLLALVEAFQKNDEPGTLKYISPASPQLVMLVKVAIHLVDIDKDFRVTDVQIQTIANNTGATSHFRVNATPHMPTQGTPGRMPFRFNGQWRIEAGQWRLTEIEELDPITGKVLNRFDRLK